MSSKSTEQILQEIALGLHTSTNLIPVLVNRVDRLEDDIADIQEIRITLTKLETNLTKLDELVKNAHQQALEDRRINLTNRYVIIAAILTGVMGFIAVFWQISASK